MVEVVKNDYEVEVTNYFKENYEIVEVKEQPQEQNVQKRHWD